MRGRKIRSPTHKIVFVILRAHPWQPVPRASGDASTATVSAGVAVDSLVMSFPRGRRPREWDTGSFTLLVGQAERGGKRMDLCPAENACRSRLRSLDSLGSGADMPEGGYSQPCPAIHAESERSAIDTRRTALNVAVPKAGPALGSPCEHDGTEEPHLEAERLVTATLTKARRRVALGGRTEL
jgi:hypothetical protein